LSDLSPLQLTLTAATNLRQSGLLQLRLLLTQQMLALAALVILRCSTFHRTGRSNGPILVVLKMAFLSGLF
jgi:hypothetical protein